EDPPEDPPEVPMVDNQTMAELVQAHTEGYEDAIVILEIAANNFELKHGLFNLVQNKQFFEQDKEDPHAHLRYFNKITSTMRVPNDMVRALLLNKKNQSLAPAPSLTPAPVKATLELADRSVSKPISIAKDVSVKVGVFHFPADFVVVDFEPDPRVPLILRMCFLKTGRALIDVHKGELTLRIENEAITYNLDQTLRYSANYNQMTANKIDVIDIDCEEYSQEVLGFFDVTASGNPTPYDDPIVSTTSHALTLIC
nr:reverse transcriptase domain-containing protein [Tanacetum cinerariifolium]